MNRQKSDILIAILSLSILLFQFSCNSPNEYECPIDDAIVWQRVLSQSLEDERYITVSSKSGVDHLPNTYSRLSGDGQFFGLNIPGCDIKKLVQRLIDRNKIRSQITLESNPKLGYIVESDIKIKLYFSVSDGGGWERWYKDHPQSSGIATVSLPVYDPESHTVMVYCGIQRHWLNGEGWLFVYKLEDTTLQLVGSVMLWIS